MGTREETLRRLRDQPREIAPGQKYVVDEFRPEDAEGIARLYHAVYGETFAVDLVYDPEAIRSAHAGGLSHYVVGRTERGDIVGLYSVFRNPPGRHIMEGGAWIVLPGYRNGPLALRLAERVHLAPPASLALNVLYGQIVCDTLTTQKLARRYGTLFSSLELEAMPPRPEGEEVASGGRISLLDGFIIYRDVPHAVHLPAQYEGFLRGIHQAGGLTREILADEDPAEAQCVCAVERMDQASLAKMTVRAHGRDLGDQLRRMEESCPDRHVYQLVLPLWRRGSTRAVQAARERGYFLGGLLPLWADRDCLLMQKVQGEPDFSKILLLQDSARALLAAVHKDREAVRTAAC